MMDVNRVPGLTYIPCYISIAEQEEFCNIIDSQPWLTDLKRRVQHYGWRYDYKARRVSAEAYLGPLPDWALSLAERLGHDWFKPEMPDQLIINEYVPGQGIAPHVDCVPCFTDTIVSLSLGSTAVMTFTHLKTKVEAPVLMEPGSLVVMQGEARHGWKHGIAGRKNDTFEGRTLPRGRRLSMTFRRVKAPAPGGSAPAR